MLDWSAFRLTEAEEAELRADFAAASKLADAFYALSDDERAKILQMPDDERLKAFDGLQAGGEGDGA